MIYRAFIQNCFTRKNVFLNFLGSTTLKHRATQFCLLCIFLITVSCNVEDSGTEAFYLKGLFKCTQYGDIYKITDDTFEAGYNNNGEYERSYSGKIVVRPAASSGIIIIRYTSALYYDEVAGRYKNTNNKYLAPVIDNYYAIAYRNLTTMGVELSGAYKPGGVDCAMSASDAINEFTIENGYFSTYSVCDKFE